MLESDDEDDEDDDDENDDDRDFIDDMAEVSEIKIKKRNYISIFILKIILSFNSFIF